MRPAPEARPDMATGGDAAAAGGNGSFRWLKAGAAVYWTSGFLLAVNEILNFSAWRDMQVRFSLMLIMVMGAATAGLLAAKASRNTCRRASGVVWLLVFPGYLVLNFVIHGGTMAKPAEWVSVLLALGLFAGTVVWCERTAKRGSWSYLAALLVMITVEVLWALQQFENSNIRALATTSNPNQLAGLVLLGAILGSGFSLLGFHRRRYILASLATLSTGVCLGGLFLTGSRGALFGLITGLMAGLLLLTAARRRWWIFSSLLGLLLALMVPLGLSAGKAWQNYQAGWVGLDAMKSLRELFSGNMDTNVMMQRYFDFDDTAGLDSRDLLIAAIIEKAVNLEKEHFFLKVQPSGYWSIQQDRLKSMFSQPGYFDMERLRALMSGFEMIRDRPLLGTGPGNFNQAAPNYLLVKNSSFIVSHLHNLPLQMAAELGLPSLFFYFGGLFLAGHLLLRQLTGKKRGEMAWCFCLGWAVLAIAGHNLLDITILYRPLRFILPILLGVWSSKSVRNETDEPGVIHELVSHT